MMYLSLKNKLRRYKLAKYTYDKILNLKRYIIRKSKDKYKNRHIRIKEYKFIVRNSLHKFQNSIDEALIEHLFEKLQKIKNNDIVLDKGWWLSFLDLITSNESKREARMKDFLLLTNHLSALNLTCSEGLEMYYFCLEYGFYQAALIFRNQACKTTVSEATLNPKDALTQSRKLIAHFERADDLLSECLIEIKKILLVCQIKTEKQ